MKEGKLNWDDLTEIIKHNKGIIKDDVRIHSGLGEDCSIINFGDYECVISTDPITASGSNIGKLAVNINCNDIASCGVAPLGIMVTILAPEGCTIEDIKKVMDSIGQEAARLNLEVLGGHTEVTSAVNRMIVSCTVIGKTKANRAVAASGAKVGDDIIVTKYLAMEGTNIIVNDRREEAEKFLSNDEIKEAEGFIDYISVIEEGTICGDFEVNAMHDITEGGLLGALWEMAKASSVGFKVYEHKLPIRNVTKKVCEHFKISPLRLISSGSMLITAENGEKLVKELMVAGINASIIGKITEEKGILSGENSEEEVLPPGRDELFNI